MSRLIKKGATDVTDYVYIMDSTAFTPETGITIADLDLQYVRNREAPSAKVDATALAATNTAHTDNYMIEIDATDQPGLYRVDWPDAMFATGVDSVIGTVSGTGIQPAHKEYQLVAFDPQDAVRAGLSALPNAAADAAGGLPISDAGGLDLDALSSELAKIPKSDGSTTFNATCVGNIKSGLSTQAELDKVPKSDGSVVWNSTALSAITSDIDTNSTELAKLGTPVDLGNGIVTISGMVAHVDAEVDIVLDAVDSIAVTGAPLNIVADGRTLTAGSESSGTYVDTYFDNGTYHVIAVTGVTIDLEYLFTIPASLGVPASVKLIGYLKEVAPAGEDTIALMAYNYVTPGWDTIDPVVFSGIITDGPDVVKTHELTASYVGTVGGDDRKMRIRLYSATLEATTILRIDQIIVGYAEAISTSVSAILADTNELQTDWTNGGRLDTIVDDILVDTGTTLDGLIKDVPTVAEFEARTIPAADYLIESDTLARVTLVDTTTTNTDMLTAAAVKTAMEADNSDLDYLVTDLINKKEITIANGDTKQYNDAGVLIGTISAGYSDDGTTVTRKVMRQVK